MQENRVSRLPPAQLTWSKMLTSCWALNKLLTTVGWLLITAKWRGDSWGCRKEEKNVNSKPSSFGIQILKQSILATPPPTISEIYNCPSQCGTHRKHSTILTIPRLSVFLDMYNKQAPTIGLALQELEIYLFNEVIVRFQTRGKQLRCLFNISKKTLATRLSQQPSVPTFTGPSWLVYFTPTLNSPIQGTGLLFPV